MGKAQRHRVNRGKEPPEQPTGLPSIRDALKNELDAQHLNVGLPNSIHSCLDQLQSPEPLERECGLMTLGELSHQPDSPSIFRRARLTRHVAPLMLESEENVRVAAAAMIRLLADAGDDVVDGMVEDDIWTPLAAVFRKFFPGGWKPDSSNRVCKSIDVFVNVVYATRVLCTRSPDSVATFNREHVLPSLLSALDIDLFGYNVVIPVLECLLTVTEKNLPAAAAIKTSQEILDRFFQLADLCRQSGPEMVEDRSVRVDFVSVLAVGILFNVFGGDLSRCPPEVVQTVLDVLRRALLLDVVSMVTKLPKAGNGHHVEPMVGGNGHHVEHMEGAGEDVEDDDKDSVDNVGGPTAPPRDPKLENALAGISAQTVALEMLTNLCTSQDDESDSAEEAELTPSSADGGWEAEEPDVAEDVIAEDSSPGLTAEIRDSLFGEDLMPALLNRFGFVSDLQLDKSFSGNHFFKLKVVDLQCRGLLALQNIVQCLEVEELGGVQTIRDLLSTLSASLIQRLDGIKNSDDIMESASGLIRALSSKLVGVTSEAPLQPTSISELAALGRLYDVHGVSDSLRIDLVRTVADLVRLPGRGVNVLKYGGEFFLVVASTYSTPLGVMAEAIDAIFDVFGEDDVDDVVVQIGLVSKLKELTPTFKEKFRNDRKNLPSEQKTVVDTVKSNLARFIQFKSRASSR